MKFSVLIKKFKKYHGKVRFVGNAYLRKVAVAPSYLLIACTRGLVSSNELEACFKDIKKNIKKRAKVFVRVYPYITLLGKPAEVRMGKGKGGRVRGYFTSVVPGKILFELYGLSQQKSKVILENCSKKLSVRTRVSSRFFF